MEHTSQLGSAAVCSAADSVIQRFEAFQPSTRRSAVGLVMQAFREHYRKVARQQARRQYHSERRAAIVQCAAGGKRLRSVGTDCVQGTAAYKRGNQ